MIWSWIWLGIIILTIVVEIITVGLTSIWMTGGALGALVISLLRGPIWLQAVAFFAITLILLYFTRPWAIKYLNRKKIETNVDSMTGREVRVLERVDNRMETGKALCNGMEWTARSIDKDIVFEPDEVAKVAGVSGVKLILEKQL